MSTLSKQQLDVENQTSFPNNTTGYITPERLRQFNTDIIDSLALQSQADSISASVLLFSGSQYKADSSSFDLRIDNIEAWSSSLDFTYATDAQLNASSSTLQSNINTKLDTASFNTYSSSVYTALSASTFFSGSQYKNDSSSFTTRITNLVAPTGTVSSSAQITAFGFATTSSVSEVSTSVYNVATYSINLSSSVYQTDATQSNNISSVSSSAFTTYLSASAWNSSLTFTMTNNSSSTFLTDATQSNNITIVSQSAWGAFQSASAYSASAYQIDTTQSFQITANALTASNATTGLSSSAFTSYAKLSGANVFTNNNIISGNLDISGALTASIPQGYAWVGGVGNIATLALTSSIQGVQFPYTGSANITGSLSVTGSYNIVTGSASGSLISNAGDIYATANIFKIISLTNAEYVGIATKDPNTLYIIV
jgi:hypothetical protein